MHPQKQEDVITLHKLTSSAVTVSNKMNSNYSTVTLQVIWFD